MDPCTCFVICKCFAWLCGCGAAAKVVGGAGAAKASAGAAKASCGLSGGSVLKGAALAALTDPTPSGLARGVATAGASDLLACLVPPVEPVLSTYDYLNLGKSLRKREAPSTLFSAKLTSTCSDCGDEFFGTYHTCPRKKAEFDFSTMLSSSFGAKTCSDCGKQYYGTNCTCWRSNVKLDTELLCLRLNSPR